MKQIITLALILGLFACETKEDRLKKMGQDREWREKMEKERKDDELKNPQKYDSLRRIEEADIKARKLECNKKVIELANAESKVKKAEIKDGAVFLVMSDDGTKRDGFADYFCQAISNNAKCGRYNVFIVDSKDENRQLGSSDCKW